MSVYCSIFNADSLDNSPLNLFLEKGGLPPPPPQQCLDGWDSLWASGNFPGFLDPAQFCLLPVVFL